MAVIEFDVTAFKAAFPAFAAVDDAALLIYWNTATIYINAQIYCGVNVTTQTLYLNLMTAHLAAISALVAAGTIPGMMIGATIDKVSVTQQPPPGTTQWQWWLNLTPYGQQLLALLQVKSVGGYYVSGGPAELSSFRKPYGVF